MGWRNTFNNARFTASPVVNRDVVVVQEMSCLGVFLYVLFPRNLAKHHEHVCLSFFSFDKRFRHFSLTFSPFPENG